MVTVSEQLEPARPHIRPKLPMRFLTADDPIMTIQLILRLERACYLLLEEDEIEMMTTL